MSDEIDDLLHELERLIAERGKPKKSALDDFDFGNIDKSINDMIADLDRQHKELLDLIKPRSERRLEKFEKMIDEWRQSQKPKTH